MARGFGIALLKMPKYFFICCLGLFLLACSSGGVEPNWDAVNSRRQSEDFSEFQTHTSKQYKIELRRRDQGLSSSDAMSGSVVIRQSRNGIQVRPSGSAQGGSSHRSVQQSSFVVGQVGQPLWIQSGGDTYEVVIDAVRGGSVELGVRQVSGPPDMIDHRGQRIRGSGLQTSTRTRSVVALGRWSLLSGFDTSSEEGERQSQVGDRSGLGVSRGRSASSKGLEVRVTPF
jgi:hypothetical protein